MYITFYFHLERFIDHSITTDEKRGHEFEGDQEGYMRYLEERRGRKNVVIKTWSQK